MIKEFQFCFEELDIQSKDLIPLLGFDDGNLPEPFPEMINQALKETPHFCKVRGGYKIFETIKIDQKAATIEIGNSTFSPSKIVTTQLKESNSIALFVCTAGEGISKHANHILPNDPMLAYIFDIIGSVTVEKAMDKIQKFLHAKIQKSGLNISDRYSPGYCDWNVAEQQQLFSLLPDSFCGISLSESSLMHPIKSVSGIIGIGKNLSQKGYQCQWCTDKNCIYGKIKRKKKIPFQE